MDAVDFLQDTLELRPDVRLTPAQALQQFNPRSGEAAWILALIVAGEVARTRHPPAGRMCLLDSNVTVGL